MPTCFGEGIDSLKTPITGSKPASPGLSMMLALRKPGGNKIRTASERHMDHLSRQLRIVGGPY